MSFFGQLRRQKLLSATLLLFTLSIGILIGTLVTTAVRADKAQGGAPDAAPLVIPNPVQLSTAFTALAKQLEPSVVNITSTFGPRPRSRRARGAARGSLSRIRMTTIGAAPIFSGAFSGRTLRRRSRVAAVPPRGHRLGCGGGS